MRAAPGAAASDGRLAEALAERTRANARVLRRRGRAARAPVPPHGRALRGAAAGWSRSAARPARAADARHVAVEFVHPVIVGKRALPALGVVGRGRARWSAQAALLARARTTSRSPSAPAAEIGAATRARARARLPDDRVRARPARSGSSRRRATTRPSRQELVETLYHVLWELVHVFFEHRGLLEGREARAGPRHRRVELPLSVPRRAGAATSRRSSRTCAARCSPRRRRSASCASRRWPRTRRSSPRRRPSCARRSTPAASCSRSATAARRPTRWTSSPTSATRRRRWPRGARST